MNTRRAVPSDAVPPAAVDGSQPGTARLIVPQVHIVAEPKRSGALSAAAFSLEAPDTAHLAREVSNLSAQNEHLLKSVDTLLRLHESEKAQRQSLQTTLDRLLEEIGINTPIQSLEAAGTEIRNGVSEDLKPLLHAIIDLLELSVRRVPAPSAKSPESGSCQGVDGSRESTSGQHPSEDLPGALPEILTKSVEELVGKQRASRPKIIKSRDLRSNARQPAGKNETDTAGNERRAASKGPRPQAWIPVTSSALKP